MSTEAYNPGFEYCEVNQQRLVGLARSIETMLVDHNSDAEIDSATRADAASIDMISALTDLSMLGVAAFGVESEFTRNLLTNGNLATFDTVTCRAFVIHDTDTEAEYGFKAIQFEGFAHTNTNTATMWEFYRSEGDLQENFSMLALGDKIYGAAVFYPWQNEQVMSDFHRLFPDEAGTFLQYFMDADADLDAGLNELWLKHQGLSTEEEVGPVLDMIKQFILAHHSSKDLRTTLAVDWPSLEKLNELQEVLTRLGG